MTTGHDAPKPAEYDGVLMFGGEMPTWSDQASLTGPFRSPLGVDLIETIVSRDSRVLVVGPHSHELLDDLAGRSAELHVLVRSWPDAESLSRRPSLEEATVLCGSFGRFAPEYDYDLVVALDGLDRVEGVDDPAMPWASLLQKLEGLLRPGGQALLAVHNALGLQQIVSSSSGDSWRDGREWTSTGRGADGSAMSPSDVERRCTDAGFRVLNSMAAYPNTYTPTLIASHSTLREHRSDEALSTMVSQAFNHEIEVRAPLKDPRVLARTALKAGLAPELAAGWFLHLSRGDEPPSGDLPNPPAVMFAEADESSYWGLKYSVTPTAGGAWDRELLPSVDPSVRKSERITRVASRLNGTTPGGVLLEERLVEACALHDIPAIRRMLLDYVEWVGAHAQENEWSSPWENGTTEVRALVPGSSAFAVFDNVVAAEGRLEVLDPSWDFQHDIPLEVAAIRAFRRFAQRLVVGGYTHPWPFGTSPAHISKSLAAMVGISVSEELRYLVSALEAELTTDHVPTWSTHKDTKLQAAAAAALAERPLGRAEFVGQDEARNAIERLVDQLAETEEQVEWLIKRIHRKQAQLRKARTRYRQLKRSREYRLGAALLEKRDAVTFWRRRAREAEEGADGHLWRPPPPQSPASGLDPDLLPPGRRPDGGDPGV